VGSAGVSLKGKEVSKIRINRLPMGGFSMTAGPSKNPQFPFILLDQVLVNCSEIANYAHGKRVGDVAMKERELCKYTTTYSPCRKKLCIGFQLCSGN